MDLGDRPTAADFRALKEALVPLLRRQLLHEVDFSMSFEESEYLCVVLPKLRGSRANRFKGDVTRAEIEGLSDDELFRFAEH